MYIDTLPSKNIFNLLENLTVVGLNEKIHVQEQDPLSSVVHYVISKDLPDAEIHGVLPPGKLA